MATELACPHCGNTNRAMISKWIEPRPQVPGAPAVDQKWYCEQCGKTWIVQALPFGGPDAAA